MTRTRRRSTNRLHGPVVTGIFLAACSTASSSAPRATGGAGAAPGAGEIDARDADGAHRDPAAHGRADDAPIASGAPAVQLLGRFDTRNSLGPRCGWPGCRIVARFEGTEVSARLNEIDDDWMQGAPSEWDVTIDGALQPKLVTVPGEKRYVLATDLAPGEHTVELYKRSEAQNGVTQFLGYDFGDGELLPPPRRRARRMEIIGDSQPAAFGVEGVGQGSPCPGYEWAARWQNFHKSFAAVLADQLHAELAGTVYSGKGMAKNIWHADKETMPILFQRALPNDRYSSWNFASFVPDVVIVMIGGNDFAIGQPVDEGPATLAEFTNAYESFAAALRDEYPAAHLFLVTSPSVSDEEPPGRATRSNVRAGIGAVVARRTRAGDQRVYGVEPPVALPSELTGCNGHGSPEFHQRLARDLAPILRSKVGW